MRFRTLSASDSGGLSDIIETSTMARALPTELASLARQTSVRDTVASWAVHKNITTFAENEVNLELTRGGKG